MSPLLDSHRYSYISCLDSWCKELAELLSLAKEGGGFLLMKTCV